MAEVVGALRWYLEVDGITEGIFREVTGLDSETEVIEHRVTGKGGNIVVHKVPGALKWPNIVLRRGITDDKRLHDWRKQIEDGGIEANRKNGAVTLYAPDGKIVCKYTFKKAWPCKFKGPALDSTKNEIAIEELELAHEGLERQQ
ncbi:MAG: phage tail protein [Chthonomonadales bacterium]|nr:phage tail protein [Chthonomonadales bacterium]